MPKPQQHKIRVYYPDTDAGGIVYHGQYLNFLDQGRTEFLRYVGLDMSELQEDDKVIFVVARMDLKYAKAGKMDDLLVVNTELTNARSRGIEFKQVVKLEDATVAKERIGETLVEAYVHVVAVNTETSKACRIPSGVIEKFKS